MSESLNYYINQAIEIAKNLSQEVRLQCQIEISPTKGSQVKPVPVYEGINLNCSMTLHLHAQEQTKSSVKISMVGSEVKHVEAAYFDYDSGPEIFLYKQNYCWTRFLVCKELMHVYLADNGNETNTPTKLRELITSLVTGSHQTPHSCIDDAALYGALEYLIPSDTVPLLKNIHSALEKSDAGKAYYWLAFYMRVPEQLLEFRLELDEDLSASLVNSKAE